MTSTEFQFNGEQMLADISGALIWPGKSTVIVSDLHLAKGTSFANKGIFLPPYDSIETLSVLNGVLTYYAPDRVICLGDSFHDNEATNRLGPEEKAIIRQFTRSYDWIWIAGNHDPTPTPTFGGKIATHMSIANLMFRHITIGGEAKGEISGHFHPKAKFKIKGKKMSARCFISDGTDRLILPAFGTYTGGLDISHPTIESLFSDDYMVLLLGQRKVFPFPKTVLKTYER